MKLDPAVSSAAPRGARPLRHLAIAVLSALACVLLLSASAFADDPTVGEGAATAVTTTSANVAGTVNPNGTQVTNCVIEYGEHVDFDKSTPCVGTPGAGTDPVPVTATLTGLAPNTDYSFRVVASTADTARIVDFSFGTFRTGDFPAPTVLTGPVTAVTNPPLEGIHVTISGTVNPNGGTIESCRFLYGPNNSRGGFPFDTSCDVLPGSGTTPTTVHAVINGVAAGNSFHYRLTAATQTQQIEGNVVDYTVPNVPVGGGPSGGGGTGGGTPKLPGTVAVKHGKVALVLSCFGGSACRSTLTLSAKVKQHGKTKTIAVGKASVKIAAGKRATVTVKLSAAAKAALKKTHRLKVTVKGAGRPTTLTLKG